MANWADYVDPAHYKAYQAKFGPRVQVEGYGSNDELIAKLSAGGSAYDVVVPSGRYIPEVVQKGLARPLDHSLLPNLKNLEPKFTKNAWDPGNKHSITKNFGVTSFYYRKDVVPQPPRGDGSARGGGQDPGRGQDDADPAGQRDEPQRAARHPGEHEQRLGVGEGARPYRFRDSFLDRGVDR